MSARPLNLRAVHKRLGAALARAEDGHAEERSREALFARLPALFPPEVVARIVGDPADRRESAEYRRIERYHDEFCDRWFPIVPVEGWADLGDGVCAEAACFDLERCADRLDDAGWAVILAVLLGRRVARLGYGQVAAPVVDRLAALPVGPPCFALLEARFRDTPDEALLDAARWVHGTTGCQLIDIDSEGMDTYLSFGEDAELIATLRDEWQDVGRDLLTRAALFADRLRADPGAALTRLLATLGPVPPAQVDRGAGRWFLPGADDRGDVDTGGDDGGVGAAIDDADADVDDEDDEGVMLP